TSDVGQGAPTNAPAVTLVDDVAANQAGTFTADTTVADSQESIDTVIGWDQVPAGGESWENGASASAPGANGTWADESQDAAVAQQTENGGTSEEAFREVPYRQHPGRGGRGRPFRGRG